MVPGCSTSRRSAVAACAAKTALLIGLLANEAIAEEGPRDVGDSASDGQTAAQPAGRDGLRPPEALSALSAAYPEGAKGDAVVIVQLTVQPDGQVSDAQAVGASGVFADAATAASRAWRFKPALRAGKAVAARIRVEVSFVQPRAPEESVVDAAGTRSDVKPAAVPSSPPAPPAPEAIAEIVVSAERPAPAVSSLTRGEVRQLPGAFGDPFRAIEALPGVTPIVSGLPYFYLRGSPPGNVGYFIDGVRVPYLYHMGLGPSIVHPGLMSHVDLYPGGYPASFGRYAGGIVAGRTTPPGTTLRGEYNVRVPDAGFLVETGFADGRGSVLFGGRYSYTAALLSLVAPDLQVDYRDFQARASYALTAQDRVSLLTFGSYDLIGERNRRGEMETRFGVEFYRADLRYEHNFAPDSKLLTALTLGFDQSHLADGVNAQNRLIGARAEFEHAFSDRVLLRAGADINADSYRVAELSRIDPDEPAPEASLGSLFPSREDFSLGARADLRLMLPGKFEVTPGIRIDGYVSGPVNELAIEPRLATRLAVTRKLSLIQAFGIAHQPPSFVVPVPGLQPDLPAGELQQSLQNSAGIELELPEDMTLKAQLFHHVLLDVTDVLSTGEDFDSEDQRSLGNAYGFEFSLRRRLTQRLGGLLSYTLSRSTRSQGSEHYPAAFDRTHVVNAALSYDLGRNFRLGTRVVFYTGIPQSPGKLEGEEVRVAHPDRDPLFFRVDVRFEKRWNLRGSHHLSLVFEYLNASLQKETIGGEPLGPIFVPSIGVEGGF